MTTRHSAADAMVPSGSKHVHSSSTTATSSQSSCMTASPVLGSADAAGAGLWEAEGAQHSILLPYVRHHADQMTARIRQENPRDHYMALKKVHDVCLYKRLKSPNELNNATKGTTTSPSGASPSSLVSSVMRVPMDRAHMPGDHDFRGITRVPGSVDSVLSAIASESARGNYWVALNTMKHFKAAALLSSARLEPSMNLSFVTSETETELSTFPRWSRKYFAAKFSKHNSQVLDCCFAEYATKFTETNLEGHSRQHGIVYRRSISERALSSGSNVSAEWLAQAKVPGAERFFIRNWLLDVVEMQEPMMCKLILTCTVFVPPNLRREATVSKSDFRDFCTEVLVGTRRALTNQWMDHAALVGVRSSLSWRRDVRCCTVCSTQFSLLRKRYACRSCGHGVCFKCCSNQASALNVSALMMSGARSQQCGNLQRECLLCARFGSNSGFDPASAENVSSRGRYISTSPVAMSKTLRVLAEIEQEGADRAQPDLELRSTTSIDCSRRKCSQRSAGSSSLRSMSGQDDEDESDKDTPPYTPRKNVRASASKLWTASTELGRNTESSPGIVLLSEVDQWTLSSNSHHMSARSSENVSTLQPRLNSTSRLTAKSTASTDFDLHTPTLQRRNNRAASENNVPPSSYVWPLNGTREVSEKCSFSTEEDEDEYSEDDLASFTLKLL